MEANRSWLTINRTLVESAILSFLSEVELDPSNSLWEVIRYALIPTGKCLRPLLALAVAEDLGEDSRKLILPAIALELIHVSSLVHDDLPAIDDDRFRRGRLCSHLAFDEARALLAGDMLVGLAHSAISLSQYSAEQQCSFHRELSRAFILICLGQSRDLESKQTKEEVLKAHALKTGALFEASVRLGIIATSKASLLEWGSQFGLELGCFFQLADDYLDQCAVIETSGRAAGSDARNNRSTLLSLNVGSSEELQKSKHKISSLLGDFKKHSGMTASRLEILVDLVTTRDYLPN